MKATLDLTQLGFSLTGCKYSKEEKDFGAYIVHHLQAFLASEHQDPFVYGIPKSWFQMLKQQLFPKWLLKRFPVKMDWHELNVKTLYPRLKSKLPLDLMGPYVQVMVRDKIIGSFMPDTDGLTPLEFDQEAQSRLMKEMRLDGRICPCCHRSWFFE